MKLNIISNIYFDSAFEYAKEEHHQFITPEHILFIFLKDSGIRMILEECDADVDLLFEMLKEFLDTKIPKVENPKPMESVGFGSLIERCITHAISAEKKEIDQADVLISIFEEEGHASFFLKKLGVTHLRLIEVISNCTFEYKTLGENEQEEDDNENYENPYELSFDENDSNSNSSTGFLGRFTKNLTEEAACGKLEPLVGRDEELERTIQVLCRRLKNNPIHVGEAGVGKTAITEGLAQKIVKNEVPEFLRGYSIYSLDMGSLLAGTSHRGAFEERFKQIIKHLEKEENVILFIDEIHMIIGAGSSGEGHIDASSLLKPILTSGKIRCIGATTHKEYAKTFEKHRDLERRFQKINIDEPSVKDTIEILTGLLPRYEEYHNVKYTEKAIQEAVKLSVKFLTERKLPDKAIDVIDEAGSFAKLHKEEFSQQDDKTIIDEFIIQKIIAKMAKIPEKTVSATEIDKLKNLETELKSKIFAQDKAIEAVCKAVKKSRAGFRNPEKPIASFLFAGPTGVGKTELAKILAQNLDSQLLRFDMSEYQEKHTVSRLIGSPPGYVGFEDGGLLTDAVRKNPSAVVLLDEIEKANSDIYNLLLQIMDYGFLTDNQGKKADFRNTIIIMTSNAGASEIGKSQIGFGDNITTESVIDEAVAKIFTPEFRNRLDAVIHFAHLEKSDILNVVKKELSLLQTQLQEKNVTLEYSAEVVDFLAEKGYSKEFGARNITRTVEEFISSQLVDEVLFGKLSKGGKVTCHIDKSNSDLHDIKFNYEKQ